MNKKIIFLILALIFSISLFLRLYHIDLLSLYADETNGNYWMSNQITRPFTNISSLLSRVFYATFTSAWFLGLTPLSIRLNSAVFSSLIVVAIFMMIKDLSKSKNSLTVALLASFLIVVSPWSYMIGRIGHTQIPIIILLSLIHLNLFFKANNTRGYLLSIIPLGLAFFYYQSMIVVGGAATVLAIVYSYHSLEKKYRLTGLTVFFAALVVLVYLVNIQYNFFSLASRGLDLAIWRDVNTPWEIDKFRGLSWNSAPSIFSFSLPPEQLANKLFLNRVTANLSIFTKNYLSFFSPDWLFLKGDAILRHSTGMVGAFYPLLLPFMIYGAFKFFQTADKKARTAFLVWILVSPIPAALTKDGAGYLLRTVTMLPFLTYFCALGIVESFNLIHKKLKPFYFAFLSLIFIYSAWSFFYGYLHVYPALSARAYEYGFKELSNFQVNHQNAPILVVWDGYYHNGDFRFWQRTPFDQYEAFKLKQIVIGESTFWQTFPNLYFSSPKSVDDYNKFIKQYKPSFIILPDRYFVKYPLEIEDFLDLVDKIKYPDQTIAFQIFTPHEKKE